MAEDIFFLDDFDPDDLEFLSNLPADVSFDLFMTMKECALGRHFRFVQRLNVALRLKARVRATTWLRPNTGWPEAVTRLRLPQNVACGFPALRSSERDSQHSECLELPVWQGQAWSL